MDFEMLKLEMNQCACLLYQNSEQAAYQKINGILPGLNQALQEALQSAEDKEMVLAAITEFVDAFQLNDNLALADLLGTYLPSILVG